MPPDPTQKQKNQSNKSTLNAKNSQIKKLGTSPVWSPILLWRKIPMAWGVPQQTEKLQKSIPSPYVREIQHLTLKDLETHLIPDGCSRYPLSFFQYRLRWKFTLNNSKTR